MAEIRAVVTVPVTAQFAGLGAPTLCAPLLYETTSGDLYVLLSPDAVVKVGSIAGGADSIIASQSFGKRTEAAVVLGDADTMIATQSYAVRVAAEKQGEDADAFIASQAYAPRLYADAAVLGDADTIIEAQSFGRRPGTGTWG